MFDRGKTLGGSSSINGGHWTRGLAAQYDGARRCTLIFNGS
jgi:choline dehydrogenase-like flavoprotein